MSMQAIVLALSRFKLPKWILLSGLILSSCQSQALPPKRVINIQQQWELEPGDLIADTLVVGSLGDISIQLKGTPLRAPFAGKLEPSTFEQCAIYSTPEVPAYLFRFCGLRRPRFGAVKAGQTMGNGSHIQFATLRRQPDGTWIIVEPSTGILERAISKRHSDDNSKDRDIDPSQAKSKESSSAEHSPN